MATRLPGRLGTLTARDVMTSEIITIAESDSVESAIRKLKRNHISGAPVVNELGRLVGILSISDLIASDEGARSGQEVPPVALAHGEDPTTWDLFERAGPLNQETNVEHVGQRMSKQAVSVTENTPLVEVARIMCDGHWHRVPVISEDGELCGVISSMDILAALVNTADEEGI